jgi:hypothetical protein
MYFGTGSQSYYVVTCSETPQKPNSDTHRTDNIITSLGNGSLKKKKKDKN